MYSAAIIVKTDEVQSTQVIKVTKHWVCLCFLLVNTAIFSFASFSFFLQNLKKWKTCFFATTVLFTFGWEGMLYPNMVVVVAFSLLVRILGECSTFHFLPVLFFFEVEISLCTLIPLFMLGSVHSSSANWDDCGQMFPDKLCISSFPDRFSHDAWTAA